MADRELVIKIPERIHYGIEMGITVNGSQASQILIDAVKNGILLPKGHGVLKDADAMINKLCTHEASELFGSVTCAEILDFINDEKPIIEADKAESEERK